MQLMNDKLQRVLDVVLILLPIIVLALLTTSDTVIPNALLLISLLLLTFSVRRQRLSPWYQRYGWKLVTFMIIAGTVAGYLAFPTSGKFLIYLSLFLAATWFLLWRPTRRRTEGKGPKSEPPAPP